MSSTDGYGQTPLEILDVPFTTVGARRPTPPRKPLWPAMLLFFLTLISTLAIGSEFAMSYMRNQEPFSGDVDPFSALLTPLHHPALLLLGLPFSLTLLVILLAHELGHYFACKFYGIDVSYPYFIPAPTLFGTFGAFIRIRSPITTRNALFDIGIAGPIAGFVLALPAMAYAVANSKIVPGVQYSASIIFGTPALMKFFIGLFHPGVQTSWLLLNPVGRAAWIGLFATALNLLPIWQLDGGHIVYSLASRPHQRISLAFALALVGFGIYGWRGWILWGVVLTVLCLRFRHPPVIDSWEPLGSSRRLWALVALAIFLLSFISYPAMGQ
jgi:Zn-dependent protease